MNDLLAEYENILSNIDYEKFDSKNDKYSGVFLRARNVVDAKSNSLVLKLPQLDSTRVGLIDAYGSHLLLLIQTNRARVKILARFCPKTSFIK